MYLETAERVLRRATVYVIDAGDRRSPMGLKLIEENSPLAPYPPDAPASARFSPPCAPPRQVTGILAALSLFEPRHARR